MTAYKNTSLRLFMGLQGLAFSVIWKYIRHDILAPVFVGEEGATWAGLLLIGSLILTFSGLLDMVVNAVSKELSVCREAQWRDKLENIRVVSLFLAGSMWGAIAYFSIIGERLTTGAIVAPIYMLFIGYSACSDASYKRQQKVRQYEYRQVGSRQSHLDSGLRP